MSVECVGCLVFAARGTASFIDATLLHLVGPTGSEKAIDMTLKIQTSETAVVPRIETLCDVLTRST